MATLSDEERTRADEFIGRIETAVGQLSGRDRTLLPVVTEMIQALNALRSLLGIVRPH